MLAVLAMLGAGCAGSLRIYYCMAGSGSSMGAALRGLLCIVRGIVQRASCGVYVGA
jgi:hypothetical protein